MKHSSRRAPLARAFSGVASCALCLAAFTAPRAILAQKGEAGKPAAAPSARQPTGASTQAAAQVPQPQNARERRAQAYAKLLEGQRYYVRSRTGAMTVETLRLAQAAFRQAAELDPTLAEAHTALGEMAFFFLDDLAQAEQEGQAAVRINPDNLGARRLLSRVYSIKSNLAEGNLDRAFADKAVAELREVIRVRPNDAEAWALLAEFQLALGRESEAVESLGKWASLPASVEGRFYQVVSKGRELSPDAANARLGEVLLRAGRAAEALAPIRRALGMEPENPRYLELLGSALEAGGGADQGVINELRTIVTQSPQNAAAVGMLARAQLRASRVDDAVATVRAGIAAVRPGNDRDQLTLQLQLAQIYSDASRYEDAIAVHEELLKARNIGDTRLATERDRRFATLVLRELVNLQQQAGQPEKALAVVERMRRVLGETDPTVDIQAVNLLRTQGKRNEALEAVRAARQRFPDEIRLLRLEAFTLADLGRVDAALELIRPRLKGTPGDHDEYVIIASLLMNAGRGKEAIEAARKALEFAAPDEPDQTTNALLLLSSAQERAGDPKGSEETLRRILSKEPNNPTALNNLGYFLAERNERLPEALELVQRAVRAEPSNSSFLDSLGWIYFRLGKLQEAERYLSDAARRNPASNTIQEHLGDLFQRLGDPQKARSAWQKALTLSVEAADTDRIKAKLNGETTK
ncbi:MAG: tetratricopeptide repeat protein [Acidobacteria bacterium]|nr:tetratricopeptide repeat protein [Acidobacteriota bacterium]